MDIEVSKPVLKGMSYLCILLVIFMFLLPFLPKGGKAIVTEDKIEIPKNSTFLGNLFYFAIVLSLLILVIFGTLATDFVYLATHTNDEEWENQSITIDDNNSQYFKEIADFYG